MSAAFVLGNGVSRIGVDLEFLKTRGKIYGCNALYREFAPDVLVATDRPIAEKIQKSGYANHNLFYTRHPISGTGAVKIPEDLWPYSSGPVALGLAAKNSHTTIWLLGFDLGPSVDNKFNNVYADTEFYKTSNSVPTYSLNWVQQIVTIVKQHSEIKFVRVFGETTAKISNFDRLENFYNQSLAEFSKQLNNG
jgi:hypothetical protein